MTSTNFSFATFSQNPFYEALNARLVAMAEPRSGQRIVDLACQTVGAPRVILFDEPSSGIAQREAEALGPMLEQICDNTGASLLVIDHDMAVLASICDRMVALDLGAKVAEGAVGEVLEDPAVIASYLGGSRAAVQRSDEMPEVPDPDQSRAT